VSGLFCILTDNLPDSIKVGEETYKIDYRATVAIDCLIRMQDGDMPAELKQAYICKRMIYGKANGFPSEHIAEGFAACINFINGPEKLKNGAQASPSAGKPIFDYLQDSDAIVAAFWQAYRLNLHDTANLHWWTFLALLGNLPAETSLSKIISIRSRKISPKATPEAKAELRKAQEQVAVVDRRTKEQKQKDAQASINALDL
jgi:hypothetical protein